MNFRRVDKRAAETCGAARLDESLRLSTSSGMDLDGYTLRILLAFGTGGNVSGGGHL